MTPRLSLPGALAWDLGAMAGMTLAAVAVLIMTGAPFTVAVDPDRCEVMWGRRWSVVVATPITTPFGPGWSCTAQTQRSLPPILTLPPGGGTAAARGEAPKADDGAYAITSHLTLPSINLSRTTSVPASPAPSSTPNQVGGRVPMVGTVALGSVQSIASRRAETCL